MAATKDLTKGSLWKSIFIFSLPLMATNVLQVLFNMSDVAVVGRFAGSDALGAVGSTTQLVTLFTGVLIGIGSGVNVLVARCFGANDKKNLSDSVHTSCLVCLFLGIVVMLLGLAVGTPLLRVLKTKPELLAGASLYVRIYVLGMPALALYNFGNGVLSAVGDTRRPLLFLLFSGVLNVALNLFFVIVLDMEEAGVAAASIISQYVSAILILLALLKSKESFGLRFSSLKINKDKMLDLLRLGLPAGLQNAIFQVANLFIQRGVNSLDTLIVKGNSAASNADTLVYDVMAALYTACTSFMGQNLGAGKKDRVRKSYLISLLYSFLAGGILGALLIIFGKEFLSLFTTEPEVVAAAMQRLRILGFSFAVSAFMDCTIAASRGLGKTLVPTIVVIMGSCVFRVIWVYTVFAHFKTVESLYLLYIFSWAITAVFEIWYFVRIFKRLHLTPPEENDQTPSSSAPSAPTSAENVSAIAAEDRTIAEKPFTAAD